MQISCGYVVVLFTTPHFVRQKNVVEILQGSQPQRRLTKCRRHHRDACREMRLHNVDEAGIKLNGIDVAADDAAVSSGRCRPFNRTKRSPAAAAGAVARDVREHWEFSRPAAELHYPTAVESAHRQHVWIGRLIADEADVDMDYCRWRQFVQGVSIDICRRLHPVRDVPDRLDFRFDERLDDDANMYSARSRRGQKTDVAFGHRQISSRHFVLQCDPETLSVARIDEYQWRRRNNQQTEIPDIIGRGNDLLKKDDISYVNIFFLSNKSALNETESLRHLT